LSLEEELTIFRLKIVMDSVHELTSATMSRGGNRLSIHATSSPSLPTVQNPKIFDSHSTHNVQIAFLCSHECTTYALFLSSLYTYIVSLIHISTYIVVPPFHLLLFVLFFYACILFCCPTIIANLLKFVSKRSRPNPVPVPIIKGSHFTVQPFTAVDKINKWDR
jgi:hypothetical protein